MAKDTAKKDETTDLAEIPRRKADTPGRRKGSLTTAKVSPRYPYSVEIEYDGFIYGPFEVDATDEAEAKSKVLDANAALKQQITKLICKIDRTSSTPSNFSKLSDETKAKIKALQAKLGS